MNICARHPGVAGIVLRKIPLMAMPVKQDQPAATSAKSHLREAYYKTGVMRDLFGIYKSFECRLFPPLCLFIFCSWFDPRPGTYQSNFPQAHTECCLLPDKGGPFSVILFCGRANAVCGAGEFGLACPSRGPSARGIRYLFDLFHKNIDRHKELFYSPAAGKQPIILSGRDYCIFRSAVAQKARFTEFF